MEHEINVPEGCKVISVETTDEMVVVKFEKDEPKFKENDIVFLNSLEEAEGFIKQAKEFANRKYTKEEVEELDRIAKEVLDEILKEESVGLINN